MKKILYTVGLGVIVGGAVLIGSPVADSAASAANRTIEFSYSVTIREIPVGAETLQVWIPLPRDDGWQTVSHLRIESPLPFVQVVEPEYGNRILYGEWTTGISDSLPFRMTFQVRRSSATPRLPEDTGTVLSRRLQRFLAPDILVPIDGPIAREADSAAAGQLTPIAKARAIYRRVLETMRYDKTGTGWGSGDAIFACEERRGNCTDIHSLLIGMARTQGIPARFVIGFPVPADAAGGAVSGYHCWAELYFPDKGWFPVDASEAIKHPRDTAFYFGHLDENRISFSVGRDIRLPGGRRAVTANYFIYPQVQLDGHTYPNVTYEFAYRLLPPAG